MSTTICTGRVLGVGAVLALSTIVLAGCASSGSSGSSSASAGANASGAAGSTSGLKTQSTAIGTVAADPSGHTLYELVGNTAADQKCTGGCLSVWPAAMANGAQVVLHGHPAFTFTGDSAAGQVTGQAAKDQWGTWYALDSSGNPITKAAPAAPAGSSSSSGGGSGGYGY